MPWVIVSKDRTGFVVEPGGRALVPWGFNCDHDSAGRLIEDYWEPNGRRSKPVSARWSNSGPMLAQFDRIDGAAAAGIHRLGAFSPNGIEDRSSPA